MDTPIKFKRSELSSIKKKLIVMQNGCCPICGGDLSRVASKNVVVDHDHKTGIVRAALHRGCNGLEGKVLRFLMTWGKCKSLVEAMKVLERLLIFWQKHKTPQTPWIYYNHQTPTEKRLALNKKRRKKAAIKREEAKNGR